jgi:hypothetical protein
MRRKKGFSMSIQNCPWGYRCHKTWKSLTPTESDKLRHCGDCKEMVRWVDNEEELADAIREGACAYFEAADLMKGVGGDGPRRLLGKVAVGSVRDKVLSKIRPWTEQGKSKT